MLRVMAVIGDTVDRDLTALGGVKAHEQIDHRRLAGTSVADDGDFLAWFGCEIDVGHERSLRTIAEADVRKGDVSLDRR